MTRGKEIRKFIASFLLLLAFMLPTTIQFFETFEDHEYFSCSEKSTHVHQNLHACKICNFHLPTFDSNFAECPQLLNPAIPLKIEKHFSPLLLESVKKSNNQLRAPPYFLV